MDDAIIEKHRLNVGRLGLEEAFDLAVEEGEITGEMQMWLTDQAFRELAAFEHFRVSGKKSSARSAQDAWVKLFPEERVKWKRAITPDNATHLLNLFTARRAALPGGLNPIWIEKLRRLSSGDGRAYLADHTGAIRLPAC